MSGRARSRSPVVLCIRGSAGRGGGRGPLQPRVPYSLCSGGPEHSCELAHSLSSLALPLPDVYTHSLWQCRGHVEGGARGIDVWYGQTLTAEQLERIQLYAANQVPMSLPMGFQCLLWYMGVYPVETFGGCGDFQFPSRVSSAARLFFKAAVAPEEVLGVHREWPFDFMLMRGVACEGHVTILERLEERLGNRVELFVRACVRDWDGIGAARLSGEMGPWGLSYATLVVDALYVHVACADQACTRGAGWWLVVPLSLMWGPSRFLGWAKKQSFGEPVAQETYHELTEMVQQLRSMRALVADGKFVLPLQPAQENVPYEYRQRAREYFGVGGRARCSLDPRFDGLEVSIQIAGAADGSGGFAAAWLFQRLHGAGRVSVASDLSRDGRAASVFGILCAMLALWAHPLRDPGTGGDHREGLRRAVFSCEDFGAVELCFGGEDPVDDGAWLLWPAVLAVRFVSSWFQGLGIELVGRHVAASATRGAECIALAEAALRHDGKWAVHEDRVRPAGCEVLLSLFRGFFRAHGHEDHMVAQVRKVPERSMEVLARLRSAYPEARAS